jgi:hypothetical protein
MVLMAPPCVRRAAACCVLLSAVALASGALLAPPPIATTPLSVPHRLLHGPGPSSAHPRVLASGGLPMVSACVLRVPCTVGANEA